MNLRLGLVVLAVAISGAFAPQAAAEIRLHAVGSFQRPVHVTGAPGDYEHLYVVEQGGTIQVLGAGGHSQFLDMRGSVLAPDDPGGGGEEGLFSVAFAPDFQQSRLLYVYFTGTDGNNRVEELRAPTADAGDPLTRRHVLTLDHPGQSNHNGGQLQFGPDGMLYLAPGDGGGGNDPANNAQNLGSLLGKVLRIDPRGGVPYRVPPDNPFAGRSGARPEIWSYGLRNPFRFSFDRLTGDLTIGDVGQGTTEEVDFVPVAEGAGRGVNFGWDPCEGSFITGSPSVACALAGARPPVIDQFASDGWHAIIGGYVVRDPSLPSLIGRYVYGDAAKGQLWSAVLAVPKARENRFEGIDVPSLSSFGEDAAGCVYVTLLGGGVARLVENDTRAPCPAPPSATAVSTQGGGSAPDSTRPVLSARVKHRQRVLRLRGAVAYVRCNEPCTVSAGGVLRMGHRGYRLRRTNRGAQTERYARVKVRLSIRGIRRLRRGLRNGRHPTVRVGLRARDAADNRSRLVRARVLVHR